jgi:hypothetical protein
MPPPGVGPPGFPGAPPMGFPPGMPGPPGYRPLRFFRDRALTPTSSFPGGPPRPQ